MWNAKDYFTIALEKEKPIGYVFTCPACGDRLDMVFRTFPYSDEFRQRIIEEYKYDPQDNVWDEAGSLQDDNLSLHPSIVHMGCPYQGHYWITEGKIINC